MARPVR
jgi:SAM-dependent methyltransferase